MRISDWSSVVCSSDLLVRCECKHREIRLIHQFDAQPFAGFSEADIPPQPLQALILGHALFERFLDLHELYAVMALHALAAFVLHSGCVAGDGDGSIRSEEPTAEPQSLMRISYV